MLDYLDRMKADIKKGITHRSSLRRDGKTAWETYYKDDEYEEED
jgi:hypothetical protein